MRKAIFFILSFLFMYIGVLGQDLDNIRKQKPVKINGGISVGSFFNSTSASSSRVPQYGYSFAARTSISFYGISIPFSINFNEQGNTFNQPFNRFGLSPKYKWLKLHLGWRNMNMSEFTLSNETFLGAGIELTPWKLRLSAMYGRFKKASKIDDVNYIRPQFLRKGFSLKAGIGTEKNYFDLIFFKAKDDTLSVIAPDSILTEIDARENAVFGVKSKIGLYKRIVVLNIDAALSAFTLNSRYRIIPSNLHPILEKTTKIFTPNISSQLNYAGEAGLNFKFKNFSVATIYRRVMPEFKSLGANYIIDDVEAITINPRLNIFKNKLIITGSYGKQRNNLNDFRQSDGLKNIGSLNLLYNPSINFGLNLSYANYTFKQQVIRDNFVGDSILINQVNHNINFIPRYTVINKNKVQNVILTLNYQVLDDKNKVTEQFSDNNILLANLNYNYSDKKKNYTFKAGLNYFKFNSNLINIHRYGATLGATKKFFKNKLSIGGNANISNQIQLETNMLFFAFNSDITFNITKKLGFNTRIYINKFLGDAPKTDIRGQFGLALKF